MADPISAYLPQLATGFVPRGPTPYGNPGARAPVVASVVAPPVPVAPPAPVVNAAAPAVPPVPTAARPRPAAVAPSAPAPAATAANDNSAHMDNPLPPSMRDGTVPLPSATGAGATAALAGLPPAAGSGALAAVPRMAAMYGTPAVAAATPAAGAPATPGLEIIRGGDVTQVGGTAAPIGTVAPRGAGLSDPQAIINNGFDTQTARAENFIQQAMDYVNAGGNIFERATRGRFINGLLNATVGPNNVGQVQGEGQNALNTALGNVTAASQYANASIRNADLGYVENQQRITAAQDLARLDRQITPVQAGVHFEVNPTTHLATEVPSYYLPQLTPQGLVSGYRAISPSGQVTNPPPKPSLQDFLSAARQRNPGISDTELTNYYNQKYGP